MSKLWDWILNVFGSVEEPQWPPEPRVIALSRGSSWDDYPPNEVREVWQKFSDAEIVIDVFGNVVKDRYGVTPRPATADEIKKATTV